MKKLDRAGCIKLIERDYFGSVAAGDFAAVKACFADDAKVVIRHGDTPARHFHLEPKRADEMPLIEGFYGHLCGNYEPWFGDFHHTIDIEQQRAASRFTVKLKPLPGGDYPDAGVQCLKNCNFFEFVDERISWMMIYYSNPEAQADSPTGYGL